MEDFLSTVPPSLVSLLGCLPPFGGDKTTADDKEALLSGCSTAPGASTHLTSVRTQLVAQLSCQCWSWKYPTPSDQHLCSHTMCTSLSSQKKKKKVTFLQGRVLSSIQPVSLMVSSCVAAQAATRLTQAQGTVLSGLGGWGWYFDP